MLGMDKWCFAECGHVRAVLGCGSLTCVGPLFACYVVGKAETSLQKHVACRFSVGIENVGWTTSHWPCGLCFHIGGDAIDVGLCSVDGSWRWHWCIG